MNFAKYVLGQAITGSNPLITLSPFNVVLTATRPWTDNNSNFIPDCDLTNPAAQGPTAANVQVDTCGAVTGAGSVDVSEPARERQQSGRSTTRDTAGRSGRTVGNSR